jgi:hypothetical protein
LRLYYAEVTEGSNVDGGDEDNQGFPLCQLEYFSPAPFDCCEQELLRSEGYHIVMIRYICVNSMIEIKKN